ncbi:MAG: hypothetical protein A3C47_07025 [Omnitrophica bacterium RIFCSPHIGHO2_02_FULL_51_18]|nr:MAG: hypothetical protein A3C47_07025 [Omnitrophica bacterium RIFCSPHIGHO2_02_FULL_51_18]
MDVSEFFSHLVWVDYLVSIAVLWGCYVGYKSGFFPELLRIAAYLVTVIVTFHYYEALAQVLTIKTFLNLGTATAVSFFVLLVGVFALSKIVIGIFLKLLKVGSGGFFYKLAGMTLGACRWLILLSLAFMLIDFLPLASLRTDIHERSLVGPRVSKIAPMLFGFLSHISPQLAVEKKVL